MLKIKRNRLIHQSNVTFISQVKETIFRTRDSGAQHGTTQWNMNVSDNSNAKKGAKEDFNAVKEFTDIETDSLIVSAAMTHFGMNKIDGKNLGIKEKFEISF